MPLAALEAAVRAIEAEGSAKMLHLGILLLVALPCLLGAWIGSYGSRGGKLAGAAVGLFAALGTRLIGAVIFAVRRHG